ncbi:Protein of unknown function (DUF1538) [Desulfitobacterium dichloroeliminans LMG P-21439]|uniref:DUF1538 domain-containing protein n=1 Tax=Desulfitobacterium dichloroeliminans (strain LMG P-21439 / DCA1) TaxID=871963 RepID=L0F3M2_DESDL|nr:DUF1538 domain-containing protein [Desulfitobacterium dichloroeliminans]AGA68439.1 Protein of unknown function (DUF1538) [Desulfitobacterium dichloroeliminans LMG P-21439]
MSVLLEKLKEILWSVVPIVFIVLVLNFTITPLEPYLIIRFLLGALFIVLGLAIFLFGVDIGISKVGTLMGGALAKSNKLWIIIGAGLLLGFFISIAEPDLHILAGQVDMVTSGVISKLSLVVVVSIGVAMMLTCGLVRIVYNIPLYKLLTVLYLLILGLSFFTSSEFLAISFDASGATTGALTVPFMLALALGVSSLKKDGKASEKDSFGLVAVTSTGAILAVMIMSILSKQDKITGSLQEAAATSTSVLAPFMHKLPSVAWEILIALAPIILVFLVFQKVSFKISKKAYRKVLKGLLYTFIGLVLFLTGVNAGFMEVGTKIGYSVAALDNKLIVIGIGFLIGLVVVLAEPAVYVLTHQIEDVTSGYVRRPVVLIALSIGVAFAVALSMVRILVPGLQLWHFLLPGYVVSILMMYFVPKLFVGIAFDAGGVASGPMTATFILAFAQGAAEAIEGANVLVDGFGVIAMVAMTPIIALQTLGFIFKIKSVKEGLEQHEG